MRVPNMTVDEEEVNRLIAHLDLTDCLGDEPLEFELLEGGNNLSGGQQQRLAILRALRIQRPVLILDEATSALDGLKRDAVFELLRKRADSGTNVLLITHDMSLAEQCDTVLDLGDDNVQPVQRFNRTIEKREDVKEIILGLNAYHADSSAAIFVDGILIAATEEERFRRIKHWAGFPSEAITFCLGEVGCTLEEVTAITIGRDPSAKKLNKAAFVLKHPLIAKSLWNQRSANKDDITLLHEQFRLVEPGVDVDMVRGKLRFIEHHRSHLGSAFFPSPFEEAAILSIDGSGDFSTTMLARGKGTQIEVLESLDFPNSVGLFYTAFTQYLGFPHYGDEYKVMGLAPYGNPQYVDKVAQILPLKEGGLFQWPSSHFNLQNGVVSYPDNLPVVAPLFGQKFIDLFGPARQKEDELTQYHMDLAASVQRYTEEVIFHVLRRLHAITGLDKVCIAGGVAQNSVANGKITRNTPFKEVYIPSAGHDAGISMGSAQYHWHHDLGRDRVAPIYSAYTGSQFGDDAIAQFLDEKGVEYTRFEKDEDLYDAVSDALVDGKVIGWFSGRAEFGPRALGAREHHR